MTYSRETRIAMFIAAFASYRNWAVEQPAGSNKGQVVEAALKLCGLGPGYPWCAAMVALAGTGSQYDPVAKKSLWPLPKTAGCYALGEFGKKHKVLYDTPQVGDVFLIWFDSLKRFGHTGVVTHVFGDGTYLTLEGNAAASGTREGVGVYDLKRTVRPKDRFLRWVELYTEQPD